MRERNGKQWVSLAMASVWLTAAGVARGQENKPAEGAAAKEPPANQWVKINEIPRVMNVPMVYAPNVKRFVMVMPEGVRFLDLETRAWKAAPVPGKWPYVGNKRGTFFQVAWNPRKGSSPTWATGRGRSTRRPGR